MISGPNPKQLCRLHARSALFLLFAGAYAVCGSEPASQPGLTNRAGAGNSFAAALSHDGQVIVFASEANNLVANDDFGPYLDLFSRNLQSNTTRLLSVSRFGVGGGNGNSLAPSVSSNGNWIAFESAASNLVADDTNGFTDVFLRDVGSGVTTLISRNSTDTGSGNGYSRTPHISADGRYVLFESQASNLVTNDFNGTNDVFVRDIQSGTTRLVSFSSAGTSANGPSSTAALTPDGRFVVFVSSATDLAPGATNANGDIFVCDLQQNNIAWGSFDVRSRLAGGAYRCFHPVISSDGRFVAFKAQNLNSFSLDASVFLVDLKSRLTTKLTDTSLQATFPQISEDGRYVAYESDLDVLVFDATLQTNLVASASLDGDPGTGSANTPIMSEDGRRIAFLSDSEQLVPNFVPSTIFQIYSRDLDVATTVLITITTNGVGSAIDSATALPVISAEGNIIAFDSRDTQLVADDQSLTSDVFVHHLGEQTTELVSIRRPENAAATGLGMTFLTPNCFSSNGQILVFASMDNNFVEGDTNGFADIFIRDLPAGTNAAGSVYPPISIVDGQTSTNNILFRTNFTAHNGVLSGNGRYVAFIWEQGLHQFSSPSTYIYVHDFASNSTAFLSRVLSGGPSDQNSSSPAINWNGSIVGFDSGSRYLADYVAFSFNRKNVFITRGGTNYLVSVNQNGNANGNADSFMPIITADSRWIIFTSAATDLTSDSISGGYYRLFAHDLTSSQTRLLSFDQSGAVLNETCTGAVVSANSQFVAFHTTTSQSIYRFDLSSPAQTNLLVCTNCSYPSISREGRFVAYQSRDAGSGFYQLFVKDIESNTTASVSVNRSGNGGANGHSRWAQISPDARYLVFTSDASDLVDNDFNKASDIFVRDLVAGTTMLLSINAQGTASGNKASSRPVLAPNGRMVAFQSFASDLVPGDYNQTRDIFVVRLASPDTDHDGLDDDWELAYFNTLSRDGSGDFDGDGHTDREEFLAGTDPTNAGSVFRVLTLSRISGGSVTVFWTAVPGKTYDVQYKENVEDPSWTTVASGVTAAGSTASAIDNSNGAAGQRFYRVVLVQ